MSPTILADERPTARRQHECSDCWRTIEPGEQYRRQRLIGDDGPYVWKACAHCDLVFDWIWATDKDAGYYYTEGLSVRDYLADADGLDALRAGVLDKWRGFAVDDVRALLVPVGTTEQEQQQ